jgi:hypothetical protein
VVRKSIGSECNTDCFGGPSQIFGYRPSPYFNEVNSAPVRAISLLLDRPLQMITPWVGLCQRRPADSQVGEGGSSRVNSVPGAAADFLIGIYRY